MSDLDRVLERLDAGRDAAVERLFDFLRIDSVSTDPSHTGACREAADWLVRELANLGLDAQRHDTDGHPMVTAEGGSGEHRYLFYGHYDVQPADPLSLWSRPPFEPAVIDTPDGPVIRARGAADDKGQLMTFVEACRAWIDVTGDLPTRVVFFFEGEEESGSPSLLPFLAAERERLSADLALVCDTGMWDSDTPAISTMLRGMAAEQITIRGPRRDLHSGMYGGPAINPIRVLTDILGDLHDAQGRVTLPGFYDGVDAVPTELQEQWRQLDGEDGAFGKAFLADVGLSEPAGEAGYSVLEQIWARPTCEINGIVGGYTGEGFKTVLPAEAMAKVSFRLVGRQDPERIATSLRTFVESRLPADCEVEFLHKPGAPATVMPVDAPEFERARDALSAEWPNAAVFAGCGGSIPVVGHFREQLGMDSLLIGFGLDGDAIHSPNEQYSLRSFHKGARSWARVLDALAK